MRMIPIRNNHLKEVYLKIKIKKIKKRTKLDIILIQMEKHIQIISLINYINQEILLIEFTIQIKIKLQRNLIVSTFNITITTKTVKVYLPLQ